MNNANATVAVTLEDIIYGGRGGRIGCSKCEQGAEVVVTLPEEAGQQRGGKRWSGVGYRIC